MSFALPFGVLVLGAICATAGVIPWWKCGDAQVWGLSGWRRLLGVLVELDPPAVVAGEYLSCLSRKGLA